MLKTVESSIQEINAISILSDRDYGWVWEYAKLRFDHSVSDMDRADKKANSLIKLAVSGLGAFWALLVYFIKESSLLPASAFNLCIVLGLACLFLSGISCICCLLPVRRLLPCGEELAIQFINENPEASRRPQGRFGLGLKACSDFQERAATKKSWWVLTGFILLVVSFALLSFGVYSWMLLWKI
jgi:hypothetical protein